MKKDQFVYVTYIRTTPEKLWNALIKPEFTRQFWFNTTQESEWKAGASWKILMPDGRVADSGEVLEIEPRRRLVLKWRHELGPELKAEGYSRLTYQLEKEGNSVKLPSFTRSRKKVRNSSKPCRPDGLISWLVSKVFWKPANRWKKPANGRAKDVIRSIGEFQKRLNRLPGVWYGGRRQSDSAGSLTSKHCSLAKKEEILTKSD